MSTVSDTSNVSLGQQMELSTASAKNQMKFQERMSNTAHQREVKDLQAAGLNPVLSAGGQGASTPSGAEGDYSGAKTLQSELKDLLNVSSSTAKSAIKTAGNLANAVEAIFSKYEVSEDDKINNIKKAIEGNLDNYKMNPSVVDTLNTLSISINNGRLTLSTSKKDRKGNRYSNGIMLGDLISGILETESAVGNSLHKRGLYSDSFKNSVRYIENYTGQKLDTKSKKALLNDPFNTLYNLVSNSIKSGAVSGTVGEVILKKLNSAKKVAKDSATDSNLAKKEQLQVRNYKSSTPSKHSTSSHSSKTVSKGNGSR